MSARGTTNTNSRGSAASRRARKAWVLREFDPDLGPDQARCHLGVADGCLRVVDFTTVSIDRWPIPGCQGGSYRRGNIRPVCLPCNSKDGGSIRATVTVVVTR